MKTIHIIGGGTVSHVRCHTALCMPAYGETAIALAEYMNAEIVDTMNIGNYRVQLHLTKMADPRGSNIETNEDVEALLDQLIADPDTRGIIWNVALTDFDGKIGEVESGKYAERLSSAVSPVMHMTPKKKLVNKIRETRKDIFAVGFKTTFDESPDIQYRKGLKLLKRNSLNLVVANDTGTRNNMIIAPEETRYQESTDRELVLRRLCKIMLSRMSNTFTRSTVIPGENVPWDSSEVPSNLREVVDYCIDQGAYKPVLGKTAGHFAVKVADDTFLTSVRKSNFNDLSKVGLVKIVSSGEDQVIAYGSKPSVGGQSQRIIFREHQDLDCIVHFHCPPRDVNLVPVAQQWPNECGSHECGRNTSAHLRLFDLGDGHSLKMVYLDSHGPNIVFNRNTPAQKVKAFIDQHFDLSDKTGGLLV